MNQQRLNHNKLTQQITPSEIELQEKEHYNKKVYHQPQSGTQKDSYTVSTESGKRNQNQQQNSQNYQEDSDENSQKDQTPQQSQRTVQSIDPNDTVQLYELPKQPERKKYGNMLIFLESKHILLSLGPNYIFFLFAYLSFTFATIYLVGLVNSAMENSYFKLANFVFCWGQNLSYLLVALSNPGVVVPNQNTLMTQDDIKNNRMCKKCGVIQNRKTYHCRECNVCVQDYDHHCPWTSKCIGGGNLKRFYFFVIMTPIYIFYYMVVFMICMANLTVGHNKNLKAHTLTF